ncbi:MAG: site-specific integrase [Bacteroidota bacterium]
MNSKRIYISPYVKKNGNSKLYLQVLLGRRTKKLFDLEIEWPRQYFDDQKDLCLPREANDSDTEDYNILLDDAKHKASEIFKTYRLQGKRLTMSLFVKEWNNANQTDFIGYMREKMLVRLRERDISDTTYKNHKRVLNKLDKYAPQIAFAEFDHNWAYKFEAWLKKNIRSMGTNGTNSRWHYHKTVRAYIRIATKNDKIKCENPYDYFIPKKAESSWKPIYEKDLQSLISYYYSDGISNEQKRCLRRFLFSCSTSMRLSDLIRVKEDWLHSDGMLRYVAFKNRKKNKLIEIPLQGLAKALFEDAVSEMPPGSRLFYTSREQVSNRLLKKIAARLGITRNLHHHVGRSTFITLFLKNGGKLDMAQYYAGHQHITSTMIYNHIDQERVRKEFIDLGSIAK